MLSLNDSSCSGVMVREQYTKQVLVINNFRHTEIYPLCLIDLRFSASIGDKNSTTFVYMAEVR
jgi:hypothetical protein